jgi:hypothetical protein
MWIGLVHLTDKKKNWERGRGVCGWWQQLVQPMLLKREGEGPPSSLELCAQKLIVDILDIMRGNSVDFQKAPRPAEIAGAKARVVGVLYVCRLCNLCMYVGYSIGLGLLLVPSGYIWTISVRPPWSTPSK